MADFIEFPIQTFSEIPSSFRRQTNLPLDVDSVIYNSFYTDEDGNLIEISAYDNLKKYIGENNNAYIGQIVAAVDVAEYENDVKLNPITGEPITHFNRGTGVEYEYYTKGSIKSFELYKVNKFSAELVDSKEHPFSVKFKGYEPEISEGFIKDLTFEDRGTMYITTTALSLPYEIKEVNASATLSGNWDDEEPAKVHFPVDGGYYRYEGWMGDELAFYPVYGNLWDYKTKCHFYEHGYWEVTRADIPARLPEQEGSEYTTNDYFNYVVDMWYAYGQESDGLFYRFETSLISPEKYLGDLDWYNTECILKKIIIKFSSISDKPATIVPAGSILIWDGYVWHFVPMGQGSGDLPSSITTSQISDFNQVVDTKINTALNTFANSEALAEQVESSVIKYMEDSSIILHGGTASSAPNNPIDI